MKKLTLISALTLLLGINKLTSQVCYSQLVVYSGPKNTNELSIKLNTSNNPLITQLSPSLKTSIVDHLVFQNEFPKGFDETAINDQELVIFSHSNSLGNVLSAIFDCPVFVCSSNTRPVVTDISYADFMALYNSDPARYAFSSGMIWCDNCHLPLDGQSQCCATGGIGCEDHITATYMYQEKFHVIISE